MAAAPGTVGPPAPVAGAARHGGTGPDRGYDGGPGSRLELTPFPATLYRFVECLEQFCQFDLWTEGRRVAMQSLKSQEPGTPLAAIRSLAAGATMRASSS